MSDAIPDSGRDAEVRQQLESCARNSSRRVVYAPGTGPPCDWRPHRVINPEVDLPFSDASAWRLVADLLAQGHPIDTVELSTPKGKTGYVLKTRLGDNEPEIYIKLQLGASKVIGRSFHYSEH